jgi:hypothetical protein
MFVIRSRVLSAKDLYNSPVEVHRSFDPHRTRSHDDNQSWPTVDPKLGLSFLNLLIVTRRCAVSTIRRRLSQHSLQMRLDPMVSPKLSGDHLTISCMGRFASGASTAFSQGQSRHLISCM